MTEPAEKSKHPFTWERVIDVVKLIATVWVACLGSWVTMQFNDRQHELNRIEAISQMLPHMSSSSPSNSGSSSGSGSGAAKADSGDHMSRDGAIWAVFRTANNRKMLRDLASLFPEDIYRVVSSIAISGELDQDNDAIVALQVASEKLASEYSNDPKRAEAASRLYAQALMLKERKEDDKSPLRIIDLSTLMAGSDPTDDQLANLIKSINNLADVHSKEIANPSPKRKSGGTHWTSKQLYLRARNLGINSKDEQVLQQVARADLSLANLYIMDQLADDAYKYLKEALQVESKVTGKSTDAILASIDKDGNGFATLPEMSEALEKAQENLKEVMANYKDKGAHVSP